MSRTHVELKAQLMAQVEAAIDQLLASRPPPETAQLADLEQAARVAGQHLEQACTAELAAESAGELPVSWPTCPACGRRMKAKGKRRRRLVTVTGEVPLEREYYYCGGCRQGSFPPG
jgi:hypothetical protein